jgi:hypothetical protein
MSRKLYIIIGILLVCFSSCRSYKPGDPLDKTSPAKHFMADFEVFRKVIEKAHPSLNTYLSKQRGRYLFDSIYSTLEGEVTLREFYNKLCFLTNAIGCAHTAISLPGHIIDTLYNRPLFFPEPMIMIGGRLLVNSDESLAHGTEILSINGLQTKEILSRLSFYNPVDGRSRETQQLLAASNFGIQYFKSEGGRDVFRVSLKDTLGKIKDMALKAVTLGELRRREANAYYYDATDVPYSLRINEEKKYALLRLTTFEHGSYNARSSFQDFIKNSFELLSHKKDCKNLIIDLRENTGGYLYENFLLFSYLAEYPFKEYRSPSSKIRKIPFKEYLSGGIGLAEEEEITDELKRFVYSGPAKYVYADSLITEWQPARSAFRGNVFIISNASVMSAASYFCTLVKNSGRGKIIGVEASGSDAGGNGFGSLEYELPGSGLLLTFPYASIGYSYASPLSGRGLIPDYEVPDTESSFMTNKDAQLLFIIDSLINKKK